MQDCERERKRAHHQQLLSIGEADEWVSNGEDPNAAAEGGWYRLKVFIKEGKINQSVYLGGTKKRFWKS